MKNEPQKNILDSFFSENKDVRQGQMFGYPAYYVGRSMFACLYEGNVGIKVPEEAANQAREIEGISDFRPYGKPKMREWVQFDIDSEKELYRHKDFIDAAIQYAKTKKRKK